VRVERLVEPLRPVAEPVDGDEKLVVERLEGRKRSSDRQHGGHRRGEPRRPLAKDGESRAGRVARDGRCSQQGPAHGERVDHGPEVARLAVVDGRDLDGRDRPPGGEQGAEVAALGLVAALGQRRRLQRLRAEEAHAVLGVGQPGARGGEQREAGGAVGQAPVGRHAAPIAAPADHDVGGAGRLDHGRDPLGIVLAVRVEYHDRVRPSRASQQQLDPGRDGRALAAIVAQREQAHALVPR
jgi:hypothetical protein